MAHSRGFEPLTSAFGGPFKQFLAHFWQASVDNGKRSNIHGRDEVYYHTCLAAVEQCRSNIQIYV